MMKELLLALVPYTKQNLLIVFQPNQFFNELEKTTGHPKSKLQKTFYRAKSERILSYSNGQIELTLKGRQLVQPFIAEKLSNNAQLMVIFDIPEEFAGRRQRFRNLLKQLNFKQIQLSVWMTNQDHRTILYESIAEIELQQWVRLFEASEISH